MAVAGRVFAAALLALALAELAEAAFGGNLASSPGFGNAPVVTVVVGSKSGPTATTTSTLQPTTTTCAGRTNVRTIEGDCNNPFSSQLGAVGHPLKRLPKNDPNPFNGQPGGLLDISPRKVSNVFFAQSPGYDILRQRAGEMDGSCFVTRNGTTTFEVCPFEHLRMIVDGSVQETIPWREMLPGHAGDLYFSFKKSDDCEMRIFFRCDGEDSLIINNRDLLASGDVCGMNGWLYSPKACQILPGSDGTGTSRSQLTDLFWTFGQFVDHDLVLSPVDKDAALGEDFQIQVPEDDYFIDNKTLEFDRSQVFVDGRNTLNEHSAYLELAQVYGMDNDRADVLRTFVDGKLKTGPGNLLPKNTVAALGVKVKNDQDEDENLFVGGDVRANEQTLLLCMHTLWVREHNKVCDELVQLFPAWDDERLYQNARAIVIAEYQSILYSEWLSIVLGPGEAAPEAYSYSESVDPTVMAFFSGAAFRFGHSMVPTHLWRMLPDKTKALVPLRDAFFNPDLVSIYGISDYLRGGAFHVAREVDSKIVDELRNFLFTGDSDSPHMDLVSLNLQRGRDIALPTYNQARDAYGLRVLSDFSDISSSEFVWKTLEKLYEGNIDAVDAFAGGIAEDHVPGSQLGELFHAAVKDQFIRSRDGDRFFYSGINWDPLLLRAYPRLQSVLNDEVKLHDIIIRNTEVTGSELEVSRKDTVFRYT